MTTLADLKKVADSLPTTQGSSFWTLVVDSDKQGFDDQTRYITLDLVKSVSVSAQSDITSFPLVNGDVLSDHKYDQPITINLSGSFSMNGRFKDSFGGGDQKLLNVQNYFESVKKYGKLVTLIAANEKQDRFVRRENLAIQSISWQENNVNSIEFSFALKEVRQFDDFQIDETDDPNYPTLSTFVTRNFTDDEANINESYSLIIQALQKAGLITDDFVQYALIPFGEVVVVVAATAAITTAIVAATAVITGIGIASLTTGIGVLVTAQGVAAGALATALGPVGWIGIAAVAVAVGIFVIIKNVQRNQFIDAFKNYNSETANKNEVKRYYKTILTCQKAMESSLKSDGVKFYGITSNTKKQEMTLPIDNTYYYFDFEQDTDGRWSLRIEDFNDNVVETANTSKLVGNSDVLSLQKSDAIFTTSNDTSVYIVNMAISQYSQIDKTALGNLLSNQWDAGALQYLGYTKEEMKTGPKPSNDELIEKYGEDGIYKDLTKFEIVVSSKDFKTVKKNLNDSIVYCFKKEAYQ